MRSASASSQTNGSAIGRGADGRPPQTKAISQTQHGGTWNIDLGEKDICKFTLPMSRVYLNEMSWQPVSQSWFLRADVVVSGCHFKLRRAST